MLQMIQNKVEAESSVVAAYFLGVVTLLTSQSSQLAAELVRVNFLGCAVAHSGPCGHSLDHDEII